MFARGVAAVLMVCTLVGFALAETYTGLLSEVSESKLTIEVRKKGEKTPDKKELTVAKEVKFVVSSKGKERKVTFARLESLVKSTQSSKFKGLFATVTTDDNGKVIEVSVASAALPEKAATILEKATKIEFYSLEPEEKAEKGKDFRGWQVLGKTVIEDAKGRQSVRDAVADALVGGRGIAKCFDPRHGIRATAGKESVDLVICFRCSHLYVYFGGEEDRSATVSVSQHAQPAFDAILRAAKVPLAKPGE